MSCEFGALGESVWLGGSGGTLMIQRNSMIPKSLVIQKTSIGSIDFDSPKVCGDTSIFYGLVLNEETMN